MNPGTVAQLALLVAFWVVAYWGMTSAKRGTVVPLKQLPGLDAIEEAVGRATELGRPFLANIQAWGPHLEDQVLASCELVRYAAQAAVRYEAPFMVVTNSADGFPIMEDITRSAYIIGGKAEMYDPTDMRFIGGFSSGTHTQIMNLMRDEKIAAQLIAGNLMNQTMFYAETGAALGAIQIGATKNTHQMPFITMQCDYSLIGDELYAAATMISRDPVRVGFLVGQEFGKVFCLVVLFVGVLLRMVGNLAIPTYLSR